MSKKSEEISFNLKPKLFLIRSDDIKTLKQIKLFKQVFAFTHVLVEQPPLKIRPWCIAPHYSQF